MGRFEGRGGTGKAGEGVFSCEIAREEGERKIGNSKKNWCLTAQIPWISLVPILGSHPEHAILTPMDLFLCFVLCFGVFLRRRRGEGKGARTYNHLPRLRRSMGGLF